VGTAPGQSWDEAGGSSPTALAEAFLQAGSMMAGNAMVSIGNAYNSGINGEDLVLNFRLTSGEILTGAVQYIGTPPAAITGDYNKNGAVDAADYVLWRNTLTQNVTPGSGADGDGNGIIEPNDYAVWRANFGKPGPGGGAALAAAASVPEPASFGLALAVAVFGVLHCRHRIAQSYLSLDRRCTGTEGCDD
jgi:hypothetical protein